MNRYRAPIYLALAIALIAGTCAASAQQSFLDRFAAHNSNMSAVQPGWITPLVAADPRLVQYAKLSFSNQYTALGTQTVNYGNGRGIGLIGGNRTFSTTARQLTASPTPRRS